MKVLAVWLAGFDSEGNQVYQDKKFNSLSDAAAFFHVSETRILWCINTGRMWRGVAYDEL